MGLWLLSHPSTLTPGAPASSSRTNPSMTFYGHLSNLSQDRIETAKGEGMCHLSGRGHPRTCEKLWARAPRWTAWLRASLVGVGLPQAQGASPGWERVRLPLIPVLLCGGVGEHTLHPFDTVTSSGPAQLCERHILCKPKADSCTKYRARENSPKPPSQQRYFPCL